MTKDFSPGNLDPSISWWLATRFYKVNRDLAVTGSQKTRLNFDNPREGSRVANRPNALRSMASKRYKALRSPEGAR